MMMVTFMYSLFFILLVFIIVSAISKIAGRGKSRGDIKRKTAIIRFCKEVKRITKGDLDHEISVTTGDEIEELANAFNEMVQKIREKENDLLKEKLYAKSIVSCMLDSLIVIDSESVIREVNKITLDLLGYSRQELIGQPIAKIIGEKETLEDIPDSAILISPEHRIIKANQVFLDSVKLTRKEVIGQHCYKITRNRDYVCRYSEGEPCPLQQPYGRTLAPKAVTHKHVSKDGTVVPVNVIAAPIKDKAGRILFYLHIAKEADINAAIDSEKIQYDLQVVSELVKELEVYVNRIQADVSIFGSAISQIIDRGGVKNLELYYRDKAGRAIPVTFSGSILKFKEKSMFGIVIVARDMRKFKDISRKEKEIIYDKSKIDIDRRRRMELEQAYKQLEHTNMAALNIMEDLDEETRKLEEAYADLEKAQNLFLQVEKLKAIGLLASGVAHEVKNPLGVLLQDVNYLEKNLSSNKEISEILLMMKRNIKRADDIVRSLVDFSRQSVVDRTPEDINSLVEESLLLSRQRFKDKEFTIHKDMSNNLSHILIDKIKIEQVFINIFINAFQSLGNSGSVSIRTYSKNLAFDDKGVGRRVDDKFAPGEKVIIVEVADTGIGISKEDVVRVFDAFFTTKGPREGSGLGLAVTKNIMDMHNGIIEIESKKDAGTKVSVFFKTTGGQSKCRNEE